MTYSYLFSQLNMSFKIIIYHSYLKFDHEYVVKLVYSFFFHIFSFKTRLSIMSENLNVVFVQNYTNS